MRERKSKLPLALCLAALLGGPATVHAGRNQWTVVPGSAGPNGAFVIDPSAPSTLYVADARGVRKSVDGAATWSRLSLAVPVTHLAIDPSLPSTLYASSGSGRFAGTPTDGIYRTIDGGETWTLVHRTGSGSSSFGVVKSLLVTPSVVLAGVELVACAFDLCLSGPGSLRSVDGGLHWEKLGESMPVPIVCAVSGRQSETTIYAGGEGIWSFVSHRSGGAFRSDDDGSSWVVAQNGIDLAPDGAVRALAVDPSAPSVLYAGTSSGSVYKTTDSGENWTPSSSGLPSEMISALVVDPSDSSVVYAGTSGGVFRSTDGGASWLSIGAIGNVTALALDPSNHSTLYALANQALLSITFAPSPCDGGPTTLCLHDGRFRVDVAWSSSSLRQAGAGRAIPLTSDTGAFWFFQPSNPEVVVKVIDGNRINGKFWVFYGALSDVAYAITVTDTRTGLSRGYRNPEGRLASAADTEAFDASEGASIATPDGAVALDEASACGGSPGALCLGAGRFRVEVAWTAEPFGDGVGKAVPLTRDSGAFWFFQPTNLELLVKVLDGRTLNGKFWVFFGALSNVEYTVTVTDTESGEVKSYHNDQGTFASMADTAAFSGSSSTSPPGPASIVAGRWKGTLSGSSSQCRDFRVDAAAQFSQDGSRVTGAISTNRPCGFGGVFFGGIEGQRLTLRSTGGEMFDGRATNNHIEGTIGFPYDFLTHYGRLILDRTGP